jgi:porin
MNWDSLGLLFVAILSPACMSGPGLVAERELAEPSALQQEEVLEPQDEDDYDQEEDIEDMAVEGLAKVEYNPLYPIGSYDTPLDQRSHLTGDWGGMRTDLANRGILIHGEASFVGGSVFDGGLDEDEEGLWKGDLIVKLDSDRMGFWEGGFASIRTEARGGNSVNPDAGTLMPVNTVAAFPAARAEDDIVDLTEAVVTQFLTPNLAIVAGLMQTLDGDVLPGAQGRGNEHFLNLALVLNPLATTTVPYSTLGVALAVFLSESSFGSFAIMDTEESSGRNKFDTDDGTTLVADWILTHNLRGLPGGQRVAAIYADHDFTKLDQDLRNFLPNFGSIETKEHSWSVYYSGFQALGGQGFDEYKQYRGWGLGTRFGWSDGDPNPFEWFASLHLTGYGLTDARPQDRFGLGYFHLGLTDANLIDSLPIDDEQGAEVFYNFALTPALFLSADLQYVDTGLEFSDDAWVAQLRLFVRL